MSFISFRFSIFSYILYSTFWGTSKNKVNSVGELLIPEALTDISLMIFFPPIISTPFKVSKFILLSEFSVCDLPFSCVKPLLPGEHARAHDRTIAIQNITIKIVFIFEIIILDKYYTKYHKLFTKTFIFYIKVFSKITFHLLLSSVR